VQILEVVAKIQMRGTDERVNFYILSSFLMRAVYILTFINFVDKKGVTFFYLQIKSDIL